MRELILPKLEQFRGRLVKTTGDGLLVEFGSAVDAVLCAVEVQRAMPEREANEPRDRRITYRVGINLGEVIPEGDDIFGDGVNVAARLEALAEPGGICISQTVFETIKGKLDLGFADLGRRRVKNIAEPVPAFAVLLDQKDAGKLVRAPRARRAMISLGAVAALLTAAVLAWVLLDRTPDMPEVAQPRILILPYVADGSDTNQLADSVSENLWRTLGRVNGIKIVPRLTSLELKGVEPSLQQLAELGPVSHVLSGYVSQGADGVTIDSQIRRVAGETQKIIWETTATGSADTLFELTKEHKNGLLSALNVGLNARERDIIEAIHTRNPAAYSEFAKGEALLFDRGGWNDIAPAMAHYQAALEHDPSFTEATAGLAIANMITWQNGWNTVRDNRDALADALTLADEILMVVPNHPRALLIKSGVMAFRQQWDDAVALARGAVFRNNSAPVLHRALAFALLTNGDYEEARASLSRYRELAARPTAFDNGLLLWYYLRLDDLEAAGKVIDDMFDTGQNTSGLFASVAEYFARTDQVERAQQTAKGVLAAAPFLSMAWYHPQYRMFRDPGVFEAYSTYMMRAGFPAQPFGYDQTHAEHRLTESELIDLYADGMIARDATDPLGVPADVAYYADGTMSIHFNSLPTRPFQGTWRIEGNTICITTPGIVLGQEYCDGIYRDMDRWSARTPRYVQLNAFGLFHFGVAKKPQEPEVSR